MEDFGDFRSDTITRPTEGMKEAMINAPVGDDVFGDDPTVKQLEKYVAELTQKPAALFCTTGTLTNQLGLTVHLSPLCEVICDHRAHINTYEVGGIAYHSRAWTKAIIPSDGKHLSADDVEKHLQLSHDSYHKPITKLISLENSIGGTILPFENIKQIHQVALKHNLKMHLDGARLWNASVSTGVSIAEYCKFFDTVSLCLSKGLGAPIGSVLVGSSADIEKARHFRKLFGAGWRQAGILAAAGLYAIEKQWKRMEQDHQNAKYLEKSFSELGIENGAYPVETNMVWIDTSKAGINLADLSEFLLQNKYGRLAGSRITPYQTRVVTHIQTPMEHCVKLVEGIRKFLSQSKE